MSEPLRPAARARSPMVLGTAAFAITKFSRRLALLAPGLAMMMEERLGIPCAEVVPRIDDIPLLARIAGLAVRR